MGFFGFIWKNLTRRPSRSLLTILGLSVAVTAVVALVGVSRGFEQSLSDLYTQRGVDIVVQRKGGNQRVNSGIDQSFAKQLLALDGVKSVDGGLVDIVSFEQQNIFTVLINGWAPEEAMYDLVKIRTGRRLHRGDEHQAMIGYVLAANLGKKVGDSIELYGEQFKVAGVFESFSVYENGSIVVLLSELQRLTDRPGKVTGFLVHAEPGASSETLRDVAKRIEELDATVDAEQTQDFIKNVQQIQMSQAMAWVVAAIALVIGSVGMLNTMVMSVFERTKEIGVLRAIGWRKSRIVAMVMCESLVLSLGGALLGTLCAVLLTKYLTTFPMTANIVQGRIAPEVMVEGVVIAVLVGVGGAAYPAWWSANLIPRDALQKK
ncbi:MAG TPA: ABC transporter permease [Pirellulaceae bacterium]|nr:ABC transporter permease [Pirellulaceae bacterium]